MGILTDRPPAVPLNVRHRLWDLRAAKRDAAAAPGYSAVTKILRAAEAHSVAVKGSLTVVRGGRE